MNRSARIILGVVVLFAVVFLFYPKSSNHYSPPPQAKQTASPVVQESTAPASKPSDRAARSAATTASASAPQQSKAAPQQQSSPTSGGFVAVADPNTGQLREADATDIGALVGTPATVQRRALTLAAPQTAEVETFTTPDGSVGARLGEDTMSFMVVTKTQDGKLATECIDGKKAAEAKVRVSKNAKNKKKTTTETKTQPAKQEAADEM